MDTQFLSAANCYKPLNIVKSKGIYIYTYSYILCEKNEEKNSAKNSLSERNGTHVCLCLTDTDANIYNNNLSFVNINSQQITFIRLYFIELVYILTTRLTSTI